MGRGDGTHGIPQPVACGRQAYTSRPDRQGKDLADDNPRSRPPRRCEEEDENRYESDLGIDGGDVVGDAEIRILRVGVGVVEPDGNADDRDEELADEHAQSTPDEERATTESFDGPEGQRRAADVDESEDERNEESILNRAS